MDKRTFLKNTSLLGLGSLISFTGLGQTIKKHPAPKTSQNPALDEDFWMTVRNEYELKPDYINLENGFYNIMPREIMGRYMEHIKDVNIQGAYYMRNEQEKDKIRAAAAVAAIAGCAPDELIITRNTTESLDTIISGMSWKQGDEAVMAHQDYGSMLDMFAQTSQRYGMTNKIVDLPPDPQSDTELLDMYAHAITPRTKLLTICHVVNITGQILPVRKICDMAHQKNVAVMVDGAHALGQIQFKISDLNCDYYGSSLHKWLSVPLGAGMLYVNKNDVAGIWPLLANSSKKNTDILKLNHTGTHPAATDLAIADAIRFYERIGPERKEERLRFLQLYWTSQARKMPKVVLYTPSQPMRTCAIATVGIKGMPAAELADKLFHKYKIYTVAIDNAGVQGCRVTPNIFTTTKELDVLINALKELSV